MKLPPPWWVTGSALLLLVVLCVAGFFLYQWFDGRKVGMNEIAFPVLLVDEGRIDEVCLNTAELMLRHEYSEPRLETDFLVIDANGIQYRFENVRAAEKRPSIFKRIFNATIYNNLRFNVEFTLRRSGKVTPELLGKLLEDQDLPVSSSGLSDRFTGFRERRFAEYGHYFDRWPGTWAKEETSPPVSQ